MNKGDALILVPEHLKCYAAAPTQRGNRLTFALRCTCGCEAFTLMKRCFTEHEKQQISTYESSMPDVGWHTVHGRLNQEGKPYHYIRTWWGGKKRITFPQTPVCMRLQIVKAVCPQCRTEITVFDSRYHGRTGLLSTDTEARQYTPRFVPETVAACGIAVTIGHDLPPEAADNAADGLHAPAQAADGFTWIRICASRPGGARKTLLDLETD